MKGKKPHKLPISGLKVRQILQPLKILLREYHAKFVLIILNLDEIDTFLLHLAFLLKKRTREKKTQSEANMAKCQNLLNLVGRYLGVCYDIFCMLEMLHN